MHKLTIREERRLSYLGNHPTDWRSENAYPCKEGCSDPHQHSGTIVNIYAHCLCGWDQFVGHNIDKGIAIIEARLEYLQHQINDITGLK